VSQPLPHAQAHPHLLALPAAKQFGDPCPLSSPHWSRTQYSATPRPCQLHTRTGGNVSGEHFKASASIAAHSTSERYLRPGAPYYLWAGPRLRACQHSFSHHRLASCGVARRGNSQQAIRFAESEPPPLAPSSTSDLTAALNARHGCCRHAHSWTGLGGGTFPLPALLFYFLVLDLN